MVFTLHRYIFRELLKVFALAAVGLTLMLSLGSVLQPIQQYGIGPKQAVDLMGYFLPITLTFVLPLAALFAATLVYGRFACDNELDACRASGVSMLTLIYPGLILAISVTIANLLLSFHVMPDFVHRAEISFKADAKQILFRNIERKGYYRIPDTGYVIYADQVDLQNNTLSGVIIAIVKDNKIQRIITSERTEIRFNSHKRFNTVQITAYNTYEMHPVDNVGFTSELVSLRVEFPSLLGDDIKFKKVGEMKRIKFDLIRFNPIAKAARQVYAQFTAALLAQDITQKTAGDPNSFYELHSGEKFIEITADRCLAKGERKVELSGNVVVRESNLQTSEDKITKKLSRTLKCSKALLYIEGDELDPTVSMELYSPSWRQPDGSSQLMRYLIIRGLLAPQSVTDYFKTADVLKAVAPDNITKALKNGADPKLINLQNKLKRTIHLTLIKIKSVINSRLAFGIGCVPLIMIGIALGVMIKGGHLLIAFGVSSIPAAILLVCIMSGIQLAEKPQGQTAIGIILMWAGVVFLTFLALIIYRKLLKN